MIAQYIFQYIFDVKFIYQLLATLVTYFVIRVIQFINFRRERHTLFERYGIPGPKPSLFDGHYRTYAKLKDGYREVYKVDNEFKKKYGKVFGTFMGDEPQLIVTDLDMLKKIFIDEAKIFNLRVILFLDIPFVKSILFAKYPRWKVMRKALAPFFSKYTIRGTSATQFIEDSLKMMTDYIDQKILEAKSTGSTVDIDIHGLMKSTTLRLISEMAIKLPDVKVCESDPHVQSLDNFLAGADYGAVILAIIFPLISPVLEFISTHFEHNSTLALIFRGVNRVIDRGLTDLRNNKEVDEQQQQVIDVLIKLHYKGILTREEVLANAEAILFAGYDTTSTSMTYFFWLLAKHPEIQEKVREDIKAHGIDSKYMVQAIKESLRLFPVVVSFTTRVAKETVKINDWIIPKGVKVIYNSYMINYDPEIWENPTKFDPDRFREGVDIHPCAFAPFGLGEKLCLGSQLAWLEMKMFTCDVLMRYRLKLISPENLEFVSCAVTLSKPKQKVKLEFERLY